MGSKPSKAESMYLSKSESIQNFDTEGRHESGYNDNFQTTKIPGETYSFGPIRKKIFKTCSYNLNDPRSPNAVLNRTPLVFDENERTLNLNDTFSDLFVENHMTVMHSIDKDDLRETEVECGASGLVREIQQNNFSEELTPLNCKKSIRFEDEETMQCDSVLQQSTLKTPQQEFDPRSPSNGVDRTPIIFNGNDEKQNEMLETVLATLSIDLNEVRNTKNLQSPFSKTSLINKHLDIAKTGQRKEICKERENCGIAKRKHNEDILGYSNNGARTPLSCLQNRQQSRSRCTDSTKKYGRLSNSISPFDGLLVAESIDNKVDEIK